MITQERLKELFTYVDGELIRRIAIGSRGKKGDAVGYETPFGYLSVRIDYKLYQVHRMIFLYCHGYLPKNVDHIDGDRSNNEISNLRVATVSQNRMNEGLTVRNKSGKKGVQKFQNGWRGCITKNGVQYRKLFKKFDDAAAWVDKRREELHREYACYGGRVATSLAK